MHGPAARRIGLAALAITMIGRSAVLCPRPSQALEICPLEICPFMQSPPIARAGLRKITGSLGRELSLALTVWYATWSWWFVTDARSRPRRQSDRAMGYWRVCRALRRPLFWILALSLDGRWRRRMTLVCDPPQSPA